MAGFGSPCGACKFLRRKCISGCVFAPYFRHEQGTAHFAAIHKVFGASNVAKLLMHLPVADRSEAAVTISYEAQARLQNPIYGCVAHIFALQQQVVNLQAQVASLEAQAALQPPKQFISGAAAGGTRSTPAAAQVAPGSSMGPGCTGNYSNWVSELQEFTHCNLGDPMVNIAEDLSSFGVEDISDFPPASNCFDPQDSFWKSAYQEMLGVHENSGYQIN